MLKTIKLFKKHGMFSSTIFNNNLKSSDENRLKLSAETITTQEFEKQRYRIKD